jgi:hypothetical protein
MKHIANIPPRLLSIKQAAAYCGVSPNTYRKMFQNGTAPGPIRTPGVGRLLFDRVALDRAIDNRSTVQSASCEHDNDLDRELAAFVDGKG